MTEEEKKALIKHMRKKCPKRDNFDRMIAMITDINSGTISLDDWVVPDTLTYEAYMLYYCVHPWIPVLLEKFNSIIKPTILKKP